MNNFIAATAKAQQSWNSLHSLKNSLSGMDLTVTGYSRAKNEKIYQHIIFLFLQYCKLQLKTKYGPLIELNSNIAKKKNWWTRVISRNNVNSSFVAFCRRSKFRSFWFLNVEFITSVLFSNKSNILKTFQIKVQDIHRYRTTQLYELKRR